MKSKYPHGSPERRAEIIDSAEHFYKQRITPDRQFIVERSVSCLKDHYPEKYGPIDYSQKVYCPLAHNGKAFGSLFWCDCPCHGEPRLPSAV